MGTLVAAGAALSLRRVEVEGDSMRPTLAPGDRLVAVRRLPPRAGALVLVADPRRPDRLLVKRVRAIEGGLVELAGDNRAASTDSRTFGPVTGVVGRVVWRYHPAARSGRVA